jgi:hypothetical protein
MNRVDFIFDNAAHYALYEILGLDGTDEYYLELRDRSLISEFGLSIRFKRDSEGQLQLRDNDNPRKKDLLETILLSIDREAPQE